MLPLVTSGTPGWQLTVQSSGTEAQPAWQGALPSAGSADRAPELWGRSSISRWSCRNFGSHQRQALCHQSKWSCNVLHAQKRPGKAGGYLCRSLGEEPPWSHSTEALREAGQSPRAGEGAEPWLEPLSSWALEWPEQPLTTARSFSAGSSAWSPALECLPWFV